MESDVKEFVDKRLSDMIESTEMWGSNEAVEMQAILLIEMEAFVLFNKRGRTVLDAYIDACHKLYSSGNMSLHVSMSGIEFARALANVCKVTRERVTQECLE